MKTISRSESMQSNSVVSYIPAMPPLADRQALLPLNLLAGSPTTLIPIHSQQEEGIALSVRLRTPQSPVTTAPPDGRFTRVLPGQLAVICCLFNPCGYQAPRRNYLRFARGLREQKVPLYTIELAFDDQPFFLKAGPTVIRLRTRHVLWHKERLLNILLKYVPKAFDKIAWVDADLLFANAHWAEEASRLLEEYPVVQLFDRAVFLDLRGRPHRAGVGLARVEAEGRPKRSGSHPGLAWAARRELLERHGLLDNNIIGGETAAWPAACTAG